MLNHLGLSARQLANEWEAHALNRGADDASQALLTLSSLGALEAVLNKRAANSENSSAGANTPAASMAKVRQIGVQIDRSMHDARILPSPFPHQPTKPIHPPTPHTCSAAGPTRP
jgi:hypothetical protein